MMATLLVLVSPFVAPVAASAAGNGVLTVTIEPVLDGTSTPQTTAGNGLNTIGYNLSYSCSVESCVDATIQMSPGPTDPTYNNYRHLLYRNWTAPFIGATITGNNTTGMLIRLGDLAAGASASFPLSYGWSTAGNAVAGTIQPAQFFPNGFPIVMTATGASETVLPVAVASAAPVSWVSGIRAPGLAQSNPGNRDAGINTSYSVSMHSGCLPIVDTAPKGDSRFTCAKSYVVTDHLDPRATFVSATSNGVYDAATHTIVWTVAPAVGLTYPAPAPGWYSPGNSAQLIPRTVVVRYDAQDFSPTGTDADYCDFTEAVTNRVTMKMVYPGVGGMADDSNFRDLEAIRTHNVVCVNPFAKGVFASKLSTFDGPSRYSNGNSPVVVQPDANRNQHRWDITVGNQANVPGVAVVTEPNLAIEGTRPTQILAANASGVRQDDATIAWTLNTGATGTSAGVAIAPTGTWFTATTVTSGPLAGPNLLATGTATTAFLVRVTYDITGDAPVNQTRTNTATATMTYPGYPSLADLDLGSKSHTVQYLPPFGRGLLTKATNTAGATSLTIPASGSTANFWRVIVYNTANVPGRPVVTDANLGSTPQRVTTVSQLTTAPSTAGMTLEYTLNTGVSNTTTIPFTAPTGTWMTAVKITGPELPPVNALPTQNATTSYLEIRLGYALASTTVPNSTWTNTATATLTYPGMGVADLVLPPATNTVTYLSTAADTRPRINAGFVGSAVVEGGGSAVPGRNVTYTLRGSSSNLPANETFSPQYAFIAPANWLVVPGSAGFAAGTVPPGVTYTYKSVVIAGLTRQAVFAEWPAGDVFGINTTWPNMTVIAQPTSLAPAGSSAVATAWAGEATHDWTTTEAVYGGAVTDLVDIDADGSITEGFATANAAAVSVGSASQLAVIKEICFPDAEAAGGCDWVAEPGAVVGVDPAATDIEYRVRLVNAGNTSLTNLVAYDVLPYLGDTGTSAAAAATPRGSTFQERLNEIVSASGVVIAYSDSTNPCRAEVYPGAPACVNDWDLDGDAAAGARAMRITASAALAPGDSVSVHYKAAVVPGSAADSIACNSVAAKVTQIGVAAEPLAVCASTQEADLELTVPARLPLQVDRPGVVPFTVVNNGGSASAPASVDIDVPAGVRVTDTAPDGWVCVSSTGTLVGPFVLTCDAVDPAGKARSLARDVPETLAIAVVPTSSDALCFDGTVHGRNFDPVLSNNDARACFSVVGGTPQLTLAKSDGRANAEHGDVLTYTLTLTNGLVGEAVAGVVVTDTLPPELEFVSASDGGTFAAGVVTWPAIALAAAGIPTTGAEAAVGAPGSEVTRTVTARVVAGASGSITNVALASATDPASPTDTLSDTASDTDELLAYSIAKSVNAAPEGVYDDDELTYTVVATNRGTAAYPGALVRDDLSAVLDDATFVPGSGAVVVSGSTATTLADPVSGVLAWTGTLPVAGTATMTYRVRVESGGDGAIVNTAFTSPAGLDCDPVAGVDQTGSACAATTTYFGPSIAKSVSSVAQGDDGSWTTIYAIEVVNRDPAAATTYELDDTLRFGAGIETLAATIVSGPAGVPLAAWNGAGAVTGVVALPAGASHVYLVSANASVPAAVGSAAACVEGAAGGFGNEGLITLPSGRSVAAEACAQPTVPTVSKTAAAPTQNPDGSWNLDYTITVGGPAGSPAGGLSFTLDDAFDFPAGVDVREVRVAGPGAVSATFDGVDETALLDAPGRVAAGASAVYTVSVTTGVVAGAVSPGDLACAPAGSGGYANHVAVLSGSSAVELDSADACRRIVPQPTPRIAKTVRSSSIDGTSGEWTVVYDVTVTNPSGDYSTSYDLADELQFGEGNTVLAAEVESTDATVSASWNGTTDTVVVADQVLASSAVHRYAVTVLVTPPAVIDADNEAEMDCRIDAGESGTGFRNIATLDSGVVSPSPFAAACEPTTDPSVVKTVSSEPVQDPATGLWSVDYTITVTNRSVSTVPGGIPYALDDAFGFPAGATITSIDVDGPGTVNPGFDGRVDTRIASGAIGAASDDATPARHVYTVTVEFRVPGGLATAVRTCDPMQDAGGLRNEIEIVVGGRTTADVACVDAPDSPVFGIAKSVFSQRQQADGTWVVLYRVLVANPSETVAGFYDLSDDFALGDGIAVVGSPTIESSPVGVAMEAGWNGDDQTEIANSALLAGDGTHRYTIRAVVDAGGVRGTDSDGDCVLDPGESGTGFTNTARADSGGQSRDASACAAAIAPEVAKSLAGDPVHNRDGSWTVDYVVTVANPSDTIELRYGLVDELGFPAGTVYDAATVVARTGSPAALADWNGTTAVEVMPQGTPLPGNAVHAFDVSVTATLPEDQESVVDGWSNTATVESSTGGVVSSSTRATADIELPELTVTKTSDATGVLEIGDVVTYTVTGRNAGLGGFTSTYSAELWDDLSDVLDDAELVGAPTVTPAGGALVEADGRLNWSGPLAPGSAVELVYSVMVTAAGNQTLSNIAFTGVPSVVPVTPTGDCAECATTHTDLAGFLIEKSVSRGVAGPGDALEYTVAYTNTGLVDVPDATFTDDLADVIDDAALVGDVSATTGAAQLTADGLTWSGALAAGESVSVTYSVTIGSPLSGNGVVLNVAASDPRFASRWPGGVCPDDAAVCVPPTATAVAETGIRSLAFTKVADATTTTVGQRVVYTVTVTNTGAADYTEAAPAVVVDSMSGVLDDAVYNADATGGAVFASPTLTWSTPLAAGATAVFTYSVTVNGTVTGDGRLDNVIGLAATSLPSGSVNECSSEPVDNAQAHCLVVVAIAPLAFTGGDSGMASLLVALLLLLVGVVFLLRRQQSRGRRAQRSAR